MFLKESKVEILLTKSSWKICLRDAINDDLTLTEHQIEFSDKYRLVEGEDNRDSFKQVHPLQNVRQNLTL